MPDNERFINYRDQLQSATANLVDVLARTGPTMDTADVNKAVRQLKRLLDTKGCPLMELRERFSETPHPLGEGILVFEMVLSLATDGTLRADMGNQFNTKMLRKDDSLVFTIGDPPIEVFELKYHGWLKPKEAVGGEQA